MKFAFIAMLFSVQTFATELQFPSPCPSVDKVVADAKIGRMNYNTKYDFSLASAIAAATLCQIEDFFKVNQVSKSLCSTRVALVRDLASLARYNYIEVGEVRYDVVIELETKLGEIQNSCK